MIKLLYSFLFIILVSMTVTAQEVSVDETFNPDDIGFENGFGPSNEAINPTTYIHKVVVQSDGKILIGGVFRKYNGKPCKSFARLNADGTFDTSFNLGPEIAEVKAIIIQPDGKIIIGGIIVNFNGTNETRTVIRLNSDGTLDTTFNVTVGQESWISLNTVALQPDGKVIITNNSYPNITRVDANGALDTTFNSEGTNFQIYAVDFQSNGKLIIGGSFTAVGEVTKYRIARLNSDGSLDTAFNSGNGANDDVRKIKVLSNDKIFILGDFTGYNNVYKPLLAKLNADGTLDGTFASSSFLDSTNNTGVLSGITVQPDGKILIGGLFAKYGSLTASNLVRLNAGGSIDNSFNRTGTDSYVYSFAVQPNTDIIIVGLFDTHNNVARRRITRSFSNGNIDMSFNAGSGTDSSISTTKVLPDDKILIAGYFRLFNGVVRNRIAKLNADGSLDTSFNSNSLINGSIFTFQVQSDGKIIINGNFTTVGGVSRNGIARLNADGSFDASWDVGTGFTGGLSAGLALQEDGKIIVTGTFTTYNGIARNRIVRLNPDGTLDSTFDIGTGANGATGKIAIQPDGKIIICGTFSTINGVAKYGIARLNVDGSVDTSFLVGSGLNANVDSLIVLPDGKILLAGQMQTYNGAYVGSIFRLNPNGSKDTTFGNLSHNDTINALVIQPDGKIVVAGTETNVLGQSQGFIRRHNANGSSDGINFNSNNLLLDVSSDPSSLALQSDGKIIMAGSFYSCNFTGRNNILRINNNNTTLSLDDHLLTAENVFLYEENGSLYVDSRGEILKSVSVYDLNGKLVYEDHNITNAKFSIEKIGHTNQVLIFKFLGKDGKSLNMKSIF
ncbi:hypothetical protein [Flavobacterium sp.]|uniref:hypothetical protein n=1 Tax=Flavobacterium sp. TaxID=239 RepID=UPI003D6A819A